LGIAAALFFPPRSGLSSGSRQARECSPRPRRTAPYDSSLTAIAARARGMFADLAPGVSLADELIAERRAEAARDE